MTKDFINPITGRFVCQIYYNRVMRKITREKAMEEEKLEMARIRLERMLNNRPKHLPPPVQQFEVVNDKKLEDKKIATRIGLKRKVIKRTKRRIIKGLCTGLKRKTFHRAEKNYINPLNAEKVTLKNYLKALEQKEIKDKGWENKLKKANELISLLEYEPVYSNKYPVIDLSLQNARNYELGFDNRKFAMFEKFSSFVNLFKRRMRSNGKRMGNCFCHHRCCY